MIHSTASNLQELPKIGVVFSLQDFVQNQESRIKNQEPYVGHCNTTGIPNQSTVFNSDNIFIPHNTFDPSSMLFLSNTFNPSNIPVPSNIYDPLGFINGSYKFNPTNTLYTNTVFNPIKVFDKKGYNSFEYIDNKGYNPFEYIENKGYNSFEYIDNKGYNPFEYIDNHLPTSTRSMSFTYSINSVAVHHANNLNYSPCEKPIAPLYNTQDEYIEHMHDNDKQLKILKGLNSNTQLSTKKPSYSNEVSFKTEESKTESNDFNINIHPPIKATLIDLTFDSDNKRLEQKSSIIKATNSTTDKLSVVQSTESESFVTMENNGKIDTKDRSSFEFKTTCKSVLDNINLKKEVTGPRIKFTKPVELKNTWVTTKISSFRKPTDDVSNAKVNSSERFYTKVGNKVQMDIIKSKTVGDNLSNHQIFNNESPVTAAVSNEMTGKKMTSKIVRNRTDSDLAGNKTNTQDINIITGTEDISNSISLRITKTPKSTEADNKKKVSDGLSKEPFYSISDSKRTIKEIPRIGTHISENKLKSTRISKCIGESVVDCKDVRSVNDKVHEVMHNKKTLANVKNKNLNDTIKNRKISDSVDRNRCTGYTKDRKDGEINGKKYFEIDKKSNGTINNKIIRKRFNSRSSSETIDTFTEAVNNKYVVKDLKRKKVKRAFNKNKHTESVYREENIEFINNKRRAGYVKDKNCNEVINKSISSNGKVTNINEKKKNDEEHCRKNTKKNTTMFQQFSNDKRYKSIIEYLRTSQKNIVTKKKIVTTNHDGKIHRKTTTTTKKDKMKKAITNKNASHYTTNEFIKLGKNNISNKQNVLLRTDKRKRTEDTSTINKRKKYNIPNRSSVRKSDDIIVSTEAHTLNGSTASSPSLSPIDSPNTSRNSFFNGLHYFGM